MATAGGLVFGGSNEGNFFALDAKTGKPLWQFQTGGAIRSGPMSFLAGGQAARRRRRRPRVLRLRARRSMNMRFRELAGCRTHASPEDSFTDVFS